MPLWAYVTLLSKGVEEGAIIDSLAIFVKKIKSFYSRVKAHLLKIHGFGINVCSKVNEGYLVELKSVVELAENIVKPKYIPLPTEDRHENSSLKRRNNGPLARAFNMEDKEISILS